jgi:hypothetical protein
VIGLRAFRNGHNARLPENPGEGDLRRVAFSARAIRAMPGCSSSRPLLIGELAIDGNLAFTAPGQKVEREFGAIMNRLMARDFWG